MAKKVRWGPHLYILLSAGLKSTRTQLSSKLTSLHLLINIQVNEASCQFKPFKELSEEY